MQRFGPDGTLCSVQTLQTVVYQRC